jgi:hypothetical protein
LSFLASRWHRVLPVAGAAVAAAALTLTGTALAAASGGPNTLPAGHAATRPAVSAASLCQSLWAVVNFDGSLTRAGCPGTSSANLTEGQFKVTFPRNVRNCAYIATVGLVGDSGTASDGTVTVVGLAASVDGVFVQTFSSAGAPTNEPFHLSADCTPQDRAGRVKVSWPNKSVSATITSGISGSTVVVATVASNAGIFVTAAVPHSATGKATIYLSRAPSKGHPIWVSWFAAH